MIDFHCHSTASDGTCTPAEVAALGRGFRALALTDHDNVDGAREFLAASRGDGVRLAGVELSVEPGDGYRQFHLLGLGVDPDSPALAAFLEKIRAGRDARNLKMIAQLNAIGVAITIEDVKRHSGKKIVARPHFADALVEKGYARDSADAFARYVAYGAPGYAPRYRPDPGEAFDVIHAAGGIAVMAHPKFWTGDPALLRAGLKRLKERGLDGLEAVYQTNTPEETVDHLRAAREFDLVTTAGSDFHGAKKTNALGMEVDGESAFIAPLLAKLGL